MKIQIQAAAFDPGHEVNELTRKLHRSGAVVSFTGIVRDSAQGDLSVMEIEHYPGMTEKALCKIADDACARWDLEDVVIIHRYGRLEPHDMIMMVGTAAPHRVDAFAAAEFLMDYLKSRAPFWKKEHAGDAAAWVEAKESDEAALERW